MCETKRVGLWFILFTVMVSLPSYGADFSVNNSYTDNLSGVSLSSGRLTFSNTTGRRFWHLEFSRTGSFSVYAKVTVTAAEAGTELRIGTYVPQSGEASVAQGMLADSGGSGQWQYLGDITVAQPGLNYIFIRAALLAAGGGEVEAIRLEGPGAITAGIAWTGRAAAAFYGVNESTGSRKGKYTEMVPRPWPREAIGGTHTVVVVNGSYSHNNGNVAFSLWQSNSLNPTPLVANGGTRIFTHEGVGSTITLDDFSLDPTRRRKILILRTPDGDGNTITSVCAGEVGQGWYLVGRMREYASVFLGSGYGFIENFSKFNAHYYQRSCAWGNSWSFGNHNGVNSWLENKSVYADFKNPADNPPPLTKGVYRWGTKGMKRDMVEIVIGGQLEDINGGNKTTFTLPSGRGMPEFPSLNLVCSLNEESEIYQLADAAVNINYSGDLTQILFDEHTTNNFEFQKLSGPSWLTVSSSGTLGGKPKLTDAGQQIFQIEAYSDNMGLSGTFTIGIYAADSGNNAPVFLDNVQEVQTAATIDDKKLLTVIFHDPDESDSNTLSITAGNGSGVFGIDAASNSLVKVSSPTAGQVYNLTLELSDGSATVSRNVTVTTVNSDGKGGATKDIWYIAEGSLLSDLTNDPRYPNNPNWTGYVRDLKEDTMGELTGYRVRGYLYPPANGMYIFYNTNNNAVGEFRLSTDDTAGNLVFMSSGASVSLSSGQRYYFEAISKNTSNYNDGSFNVEWTGPCINREIVSGGYMSPVEFAQPEFHQDTIVCRDVLVGEEYFENMRTKLKSLDMWDVLQYTKISGNGWLGVSSDGMLTGTPAGSDIGMNSFVIRATAPGGIYKEVTVQVEVKANSMPSFTANPIIMSNIQENVSYRDSIASYASDADESDYFGFGDRLTFSKIAGPDWLKINADGEIFGTPLDIDAGSNTWTVCVTDLGGLTAETQLRITVNSQNDAPYFLTDPISSISVEVNHAISADLSDHSYDPDTGDILTFTKLTGPAWLDVALNGSLSGTPDSGNLGMNTFTVKVKDAAGLSDQTTLEIMVVEVIDSAYEPFEGTLSADVDGATGGTGWNSGWVDTTGTATQFVFNSPGLSFDTIPASGVKATYLGNGSGSNTRYNRQLASAITVDAANPEMWVSALMEIGTGTNDNKPGRAIGVELTNAGGSVIGFGKAVNSHFGIGYAMNSGFNAISGTNSIGTKFLAVKIAFDETDTIATLYFATGNEAGFDLNDFATFTGSRSVTLAGAVTFDGVNLFAYHSGTTSNSIDEINIGRTYRAVTGQPDLYDGKEGLSDFAVFAQQWLKINCDFCNGADLTGDENVDMNDLFIFTQNWLGL